MSNRYEYINSNSINQRKIQNIFKLFSIFIVFLSLLLGSATSSENVFGQTNDTYTQGENVIPDIREISSDENSENSIEQLIRENDSTSNGSGSTENQITDDQPNISNKSHNLQPDGNCLFDPSLPKCTPDENGYCPEGFGMNEDEQCFPLHDKCPEGYHSHEDDESGRCIPDDVPCDPGYIMNPDYPSCDREEYVCQNHPELDECKVDDETANNLPYRSGYNHGCSDAKISDSSKRYINQPGKGPGYHTSEFMRGYNDGFESCHSDNNDPSTSGMFRVIVQVTNQSPQDISGGITINVDHQPQNIYKSAYGLYFLAGETTATTFTFKTSEVPLGTAFEVNVDYGDDYNQYKFGENSPVKRPEIVQFVIP
ncbi:MAG TPA: hypothetical protein VD815_04410 [Candidatus Saccharimonadales bacterium]|nr:hypothetical protein [Candidatus Saccharimonadales bacterium]